VRYLAVVAIAASVTFVLAYLILKLSHRFRLYPKIRERDVHTRPTPRLGGVAMFVGVIAGFAAATLFTKFDALFKDPRQIWGLLAAALLIVAIGVADDLLDLTWYTKLAGQFIAGGILVYTGTRIYTLPIPGSGVVIMPETFWVVVSIFAIVLVMNAINFIDGLDGLVAGVALIANGVFFIYSYTFAYFNRELDYLGTASLITAVLIGACIGFLPLNFHPAKLFMGDAGALLTGLLMAASALSFTGQVDPDSYSYGGQQLPGLIPIILPFAILVLPLLDFGLAVLRRLRAGKSPFAADRLHLHHRLLDIGHSHLQAVLIFYAWTAVISVGCLAFVFIPWEWATLAIAIGVLLCAWITVVPLLRRNPIDPDAAAKLAAQADADAGLLTKGEGI
jgi:UDP-GlcNAc:undecaprenyl-phosphate GlcNAc-1-phosphate transferase